MKKDIMHGVVLAFIVLLLVVVVALPGIIKASASEDPFAAMYDSDAIFLAEAKTILQYELEQSKFTLEQDKGLVDYTEVDITALAGEKSLNMQVLDRSEQSYSRQSLADMQIDNRQLLELIEDDGLDALDVLPVSDMGKDMLEQAYEHSRVDRFIVKYKNEGNARSVQDISNISVNRTYEFSAEPVFSAEGRKSLSSAGNIMTGRVECILLDEKVNPAEFASTLKAAGMAAEIEYIQPDFIMEFAGFELSYTEVTDDNSDGVDGVEPDEEPQEEETGIDDNDSGEINKGVDENSNSEQEDESLAEELPEEELIEEELLLEEIAQEEVVVALIDTGVDIWHPALRTSMANGWNFVDDTDSVYDDCQPMQSAHGTHIAGIIAQNTDDYVKIMPLQVFGEHGAYTSDIIAAISYAEEWGAKIVNCSFGSASYNPALREAMENSSMLFVTAVGNARSNLDEAPVYPAAFGLDNVISVASLNADGGFSYYSNYSSDMVDIAVRGRDVNSALPGGEYGLQSGTSMAAGYVSAAAGLVLTENSRLTAAELKELLCVTGERMSHLQNKVRDGRSLDVAQALSGDEQNDIKYLNPEDDFDVHGYAPTPEESWQLFSSKKCIMVDGGGSHTLALCDDGTVWAWGNNILGQLGDNTVTSRHTPAQVIGLNNVKNITAGLNYSMALKTDGTVWAWGWNINGQLGDGTTADRWIPKQIGINSIIDITTGQFHSAALDSNGTVWTWGINTFGQLGRGVMGPSVYSTPGQVTGPNATKTIKCGFSSTYALDSDGTVLAWGRNDCGQLGDGTTINRNEVCPVTGINKVTSLCAGWEHVLALKEDSTVWSWGNNNKGQQGNGTTANQLKPNQIPNLSNIKGIAVGDEHSMALKTDGTVWAWGGNSCGQLGDGTKNQKNIPTLVLIPAQAIQLSAGAYFSLLLSESRALWGWGENAMGQLGLGGAGNLLVPVQVHADYFGVIPSIPTNISFQQDQYSIVLTQNGLATITVSAEVWDQNDQKMVTDIAYKLAYPYLGVSIDSATGVILISSEALPGTAIITATCDNCEPATVELVLMPASTAMPTQLAINTSTGKLYDITLSASGIASFSGMEIKLKYDAAVFDLVDLCAFTKNKEQAVGPIVPAGVTITQVSPGEIRLKIDKTVPADKLWAGTLNTIRLKAKTTSASAVQVEQ